MGFRFEGLTIFKSAVDYAISVYQLTKGFPRDEVFGMTANVRRAATSIASNIAEGSGRGTHRDFAHFLDIASGSLFETVADFIMAERLGYLTHDELDDVREHADHLGRMLSNFKKTLGAKQ